MAAGFTSNFSTSALYEKVIDDVINGVRDAFLDDGVDDTVLDELRTRWESELIKLDPDPEGKLKASNNQSKSRFDNDPLAPSVSPCSDVTMGPLSQHHIIPVQVQVPSSVSSSSSAEAQRSVTIKIPVWALTTEKLREILNDPVVQATFNYPLEEAAEKLQKQVNIFLQIEDENDEANRPGPSGINNATTARKRTTKANMKTTVPKTKPATTSTSKSKEVASTATKKVVTLKSRSKSGEDSARTKRGAKTPAATSTDAGPANTTVKKPTGSSREQNTVVEDKAPQPKSSLSKAGQKGKQPAKTKASGSSSKGKPETNDQPTRSRSNSSKGEKNANQSQVPDESSTKRSRGRPRNNTKGDVITKPDGSEASGVGTEQEDENQNSSRKLGVSSRGKKNEQTVDDTVEAKEEEEGEKKGPSRAKRPSLQSNQEKEESNETSRARQRSGTRSARNMQVATGEQQQNEEEEAKARGVKNNEAVKAKRIVRRKNPAAVAAHSPRSSRGTKRKLELEAAGLDGACISDSDHDLDLSSSSSSEDEFHEHESDDNESDSARVVFDEGNETEVGKNIDEISTDEEGDDDDNDGDEGAVENIIVCQYDKITRQRNKWKFELKDGILSLNGKDYIFHKACGNSEFN